MLKIPWPYCGSPENNDQWIHRLIFPHKTNGFFVELGAADGICGSSCYILERIGWQGICVEACSTFFSKLRQNRKVICENICVSDRTGPVRFQKAGFLSRVVYGAKHEFDRRQQMVNCTTLADLLRASGAPKVIDFLAMDIEGSERRVLSVFPFEDYDIRAIAMEGDEARDILTSNGFVKVRNPFNMVSPWERYYVRDNHLSASTG